MNVGISNQCKAHRGTHIVALFLLLCTFLTSAVAKDTKPHASTAIKVVATMSFENKSPTDMQIQEVNGKRYLFVQTADTQGITVVDISKPSKLKIVSSMPCPGATGRTQLVINGNVAMITAVATNQGTQPASKGEFVFWDTSNPANPRVVQRFADVMRVVHDDRGYSYVLSGNALSVVYEKQDTSTDASLQASLYGG